MSCGLRPRYAPCPHQGDPAGQVDVVDLPGPSSVLRSRSHHGGKVTGQARAHPGRDALPRTPRRASDWADRQTASEGSTRSRTTPATSSNGSSPRPRTRTPLLLLTYVAAAAEEDFDNLTRRWATSRWSPLAGQP